MTSHVSGMFPVSIQYKRIRNYSCYTLKVYTSLQSEQSQLKMC